MTEPSSDMSDKQLKQISRRDFLYVGGVAAAVGTAGIIASQHLLQDTVVNAATVSTGVKYAMVIDLGRCFGCRSCVTGCKIENNTGKGATWMYVFRIQEGEYPNVSIKSLPRPCMHCDNAPCVKVCPVGARYKREDGLVATDKKRCIGCRFCQVACPYRVNYFQWKDPEKNQYYDWNGAEGDEVRQYTGGAVPPYKNPDLEKAYGTEKKYIAGSGPHHGVTEKCTFCVHRIEKGLLPACVANCPCGVYSFGNLNDPESNVSKILAKRPHFRLGEELGTAPRVYYVGGTPPTPESRQIDPMEGVIS